MNSRINHVAVVVSAIVQWIIGGVWYAALGNVWLNLHAKTMTDIETPNAVLPYVIAFLAALFVSYGLAWAINRQNAHGAGCGLAIGMICWFCFLFVEHATISVFSAFGTNPWPLILLDMGRSFLAFAAGGLILGAWQKKNA
jgi:hypothetical protein